MPNNVKFIRDVMGIGEKSELYPTAADFTERELKEKSVVSKF